MLPVKPLGIAGLDEPLYAVRKCVVQHEIEMSREIKRDRHVVKAMRWECIHRSEYRVEVVCVPTQRLQCADTVMKEWVEALTALSLGVRRAHQ